MIHIIASPSIMINNRVNGKILLHAAQKFSINYQSEHVETQNMQLSLKFSIAMLFFTLIFTSFLAIALAQKNPHYLGDRTTMVHLFEWKFNDIAKECENFLGPNGYGGVQVCIINYFYCMNF